jgi:hypothetical protein
MGEGEKRTWRACDGSPALPLPAFPGVRPTGCCDQPTGLGAREGCAKLRRSRELCAGRAVVRRKCGTFFALPWLSGDRVCNLATGDHDADGRGARAIGLAEAGASRTTAMSQEGRTRLSWRWRRVCEGPR